MFYQDVSPFSTITLKKIVFLLRGLTSLPLESLNTGRWHMAWVTKIFLLLCVCFLDSFSCCKARALTKKKKLFKMCFPPEGYPPQNLQGSRQPLQWGNQELFKLLEIITVTVTLNHQARLSELMDKLDLSRLRINYRGLNELINTIISFVICLKCYWFLIFCFPNIGNFSPKLTVIW